MPTKKKDSKTKSLSKTKSPSKTKSLSKTKSPSRNDFENSMKLMLMYLQMKNTLENKLKKTKNVAYYTLLDQLDYIIQSFFVKFGSDYGGVPNQNMLNMTISFDPEYFNQYKA